MGTIPPGRDPPPEETLAIGPSSLYRLACAPSPSQLISGLEWAEHPDPVPGEYELLVAVGAAGLNGADLLQRKGFYPPPPASLPTSRASRWPVWWSRPGSRTTRFKVGDLVMALVGGAAQAELAITDERTAIPVPADWTSRPPAASWRLLRPPSTPCSPRRGWSRGDAFSSPVPPGGGTSRGPAREAAGATVVASTRHREFNNDLIELGASAAVTAGAVRGVRAFRRRARAGRGTGPADSVAVPRHGGASRGDRRGRRIASSSSTCAC